jgi:hypothetical protein
MEQAVGGRFVKARAPLHGTVMGLTNSIWE